MNYDLMTCRKTMPTLKLEQAMTTFTKVTEDKNDSLLHFILEGKE